MLSNDNKCSYSLNTNTLNIRYQYDILDISTVDFVMLPLSVNPHFTSIFYVPLRNESLGDIKIL